MRQYNKSILPNGVTLISETLASYNSTVISLWINIGSRGENKGQEGYSHLVEHMLFKGTKNNTGKQIISEIEKLGGEINAFTTREQTCYTVSILSKDYKKAIEILCDIYLNSTIKQEHLEVEKSVIINELLSVDDDPEEYLIDKIYEETFKNSKLSLPILGNKNSIESCDRSKLLEFYKTQYKAGNMTFIASGNIVHDDLLAEISENTLKYSGTNSNKRSDEKPETFHSLKIIQKQLELVHCGIAFSTVSYNDSQKSHALLLNAILGEGMNSRLFQEIRENMGLVYNIFSDLAFYDGTSILIIYFSCEKEDISTTIKKITDELALICNTFIKQEELDEYKNQIQGSMQIELDSLENRVHSLAKEHFYLGKNIQIEEHQKEIHNVKINDLHQYAKETIDINKATCVILGQVSKEDEQKISEELNL